MIIPNNNKEKKNAIGVAFAMLSYVATNACQLPQKGPLPDK